MILDLLADGKRVGVTANSHKVISNLLGAVCDAADDRSNTREQAARAPGGRAGDERARLGRDAETPPRGAPVEVHGIQKARDGDGCPDERIVPGRLERRGG